MSQMSHRHYASRLLGCVSIFKAMILRAQPLLD
uniref:Uncharacterized protein n=1 Tax=Anguilla anguilla TaxID=7936 RepID=A0A0E9Q237_ANGAN